MSVSVRAKSIATQVEKFVREIVVPYEGDPRRDTHGPSDELASELKQKAREEGVLTPHILDDGTHLTHEEVALVLRKTGLSPLGPVACNTAAPDEGNMFLLSKVGSEYIKRRFLYPLIQGDARSAFFMTEPADEGGAGSDPSMMQTTCRLDGNHWVVNGRKAFITGAEGAKVGIVMAKSVQPGSEGGACMFLVELPDPAVRIERVLDTIDSSMPGGHAVISIDNLRVPAEQMLGDAGQGFTYAQVRLAPARLTHCMRWLGACQRSQEIATDYSCRRQAFGKQLIEHEGVGFMIAQNRIDLKACELMINWCARVLDSGKVGTMESSMVKAFVAETLFQVADRCVQAMGGTGVTGDTIVEQVFREVRAFRIYDGPTEVHKWSLAKNIKREWQDAQSE
jgi:acyl-CoA dehydrogenase